MTGTITKKELDYQNIWQAFPLYNIPTGTTIRVRIIGRNNMTTIQQMGIAWVVTDPNGIVRESYSAWELWPYTGAGAEHEFIGNGFPLDKVGTWLLNVYLYMDPSNPTVVDSYYGTLCTVVAELVPAVSEFAVSSFSKV